MAENGTPKRYIENLFERAKEVPFDVVLEKLELLSQLRRVGYEIRGACPICGGERCFSAKPVKGMYNCFRCHKGGDVTAFVARYKKIEEKEAATWIVSLIPPAEGEIPDREADTINALPSLGLTHREVCLLHIMTKAQIRYIAEMSRMFASVADQMEQSVWKFVKEEIVGQFPETTFQELGE
jgi:DNA primase